MVGIAKGDTAQRSNGSGGKPAPEQVRGTVPFIRASSEHREPAGIDVTRQISASDQDLSIFDIPAYGFVRSIVLLVEATGGAGSSVTSHEDGPWNVIKNIALTEPNGSVIQQFNSGHDLFLANKWGGYRNAVGADPRKSPVYSAIAAASGNFRFLLRIPVEINLRDALGSLPNQSAAATFKLRLSLAAAAQVYGGTVPSTLPNIRVRAFLEAWDQPEDSAAGQANQTMPPAMNTTQFWTTQVLPYQAGLNTLKFSRVGNYIRNLILVTRRSGTSRANGEADFPDPATLYLDTRPLDIIEKYNWLHQMYERSGFGAAGSANEAAGGLDNGVRVYDFTHEFDGSLGQENRDLWLPTLTSTRLELQGTFTNSGTVTVITNDVAVSGEVFI